jgi:hypothetical protein
MIRIIRNLLRQIGFADVDDANDGSTALAKMHEKRYSPDSVRLKDRYLFTPFTC